MTRRTGAVGVAEHYITHTISDVIECMAERYDCTEQQALRALNLHVDHIRYSPNDTLIAGWVEAIKSNDAEDAARAATGEGR